MSLSSLKTMKKSPITEYSDKNSASVDLTWFLETMNRFSFVERLFVDYVQHTGYHTCGRVWRHVFVRILHLW